MSEQQSLTKVAVQALEGASIGRKRRRLRPRHELAVIQAEIRRLSRAAAAPRSELVSRTPGTNRG
jgi:hypothetical protein